MLSHVIRVPRSKKKYISYPYPFRLNGFFYQQQGVWLFIIISMFTKIPIFNSNSVDPDQTPQAAAFDLGLQFFANYYFGGSQTKMGSREFRNVFGGIVSCQGMSLGALGWLDPP